MSIPQKRPRSDEHSENRKQTSRSTKHIPPDSTIIVSKGRKRSRRDRKRSTTSEIPGTSVDGPLHQKQAANVNPWEITKICGGIFAPKSLFSKDEKYLFTSTETLVKIFSAKSGQCIRSLGSLEGRRARIVDFVIDPLNEFRLFLAYDTAVLCVFDWTDGLLITEYSLSDAPRRLVLLGTSTLLFTSSSNLFACTLPLTGDMNENVVKVAAQTILALDPEHATDHLIATDTTSSIICVAYGSTMWITQENKNTNVLESPVSWKQMKIPSGATSLACFEDTVALGERSGNIRLYFNVLKALDLGHSPTESQITWHQFPVSALRFSSNGLYLLSGGAEDVLLISQIVSANRQFVPRLGAEIVGLGQTESGSLFAISLSNNTFKIIDAADFDLVSEISGVQSIVSRSQRSSHSAISRPPCVAILHPSLQHLYIGGGQSSPGTLQAYDFLSDQQALSIDVAPVTRTKSTGTEKRKVSEPTVTFAAFTNDGSWLATVDEWVDHYANDEDDISETFLRFWTWTGKQWNIATKIENPHGIRRCILDFASPGLGSTTQEFVSLGTDGTVKIWRTLVRKSGVSSETIWSLFRTIGSGMSTLLPSGSLTYSADGSILAAGIERNIFVIDASTGQVIKCLHVGQSISKLEVLGRFILGLHDGPSMFSGWDIATGEAIFSERLPNRRTFSIAANHSLSTLALSSSSTSAKTTINISRILAKKKVDIARLSLNSTVIALLGAKSAHFSGFIYIDEHGQIGCIGCQRSVTELTDQKVNAIVSHVIPAFTTGQPPELPINISRQAGDNSNKFLHKIVELDEEMDMVQMYEKIVQSI